MISVPNAITVVVGVAIREIKKEKSGGMVNRVIGVHMLVTQKS